MNPNNKTKNQNKKKKIIKKRPVGQVPRMLTNAIRNASSRWHYKRYVPQLKNQVANYIADAEAEYVFGIFHPDVVFRDNLNIKLPSIMPIPTTNFSFKETYSMKPNQVGNFCLVWSPNFLGSSQNIANFINESAYVLPQNGYFSNLYVNTHPNLNGNSSNSNWRAVTFKHINQNFNKYRLASACIKVKYTGKVLNQAGMLAACASFMEFPRTIVGGDEYLPVGDTYDLPTIFDQLNKLGDFDSIRQGQWSYSTSLVKNPDGITCVYIPTDTISSAFIDNGDTLNMKDLSTFRTEQGNPGCHWLSRTANISYDICGYGISSDDNINSITVECYYNYEIIVNEDQMPFFRPTTNTNLIHSPLVQQKVIEQIVNKNGTITSTTNHDNPSVMNKIRQTLSQTYDYIGRHANQLVDVAAPLLKIGSLLI